MTDDEIQHLIEEATFDYTMGANDDALAKLVRATAAAPGSFPRLARAGRDQFQPAQVRTPPSPRPTAAHGLRPDDLFINTTLSRIWMEKGDKAKAEHYGAQAKIQSWKDQIKNPEAAKGL